MNKRIGQFLIFSLCAFLFGVGPCEKDNSSINKNGPQSSNEYTGPMVQVFDTYGRFSIMAPPSWRTVRKSENPYLFLIVPGAGDDGPMSNVVIEAMNRGLGPYEYLQANIVSMKLTINGLTFLQGGSDNIGGIQIAWINYSYNSSSGTVEAVTYCQTKGLQAFSVTSLAPKDIFPSYQDTFKKIGHSLRIIK